MQRMSWYWQRLRSMTPAEIAWRGFGAAQKAVDRLLAGRRVQARPIDRLLRHGSSPIGSLGQAICIGNPPTLGVCDHINVEKLRQQAEEILAGRIRLLGNRAVDVGSQINWNYEYRAQRATPLKFAGSIDYRDARVTGDCKWVWELNRHHHLVVLARAYRATGDIRYARAVTSQIISWIEQCPFGHGINWRSGLELAIRLINWVWAVELIRPAGVIDDTMAGRIWDSADRHLWEIDRKYSRFSSANNHLIGEAAGVYIGAAYFHQLRRANAWRGRARRILCEEIHRQTHPDGGNKELATGYQLFVMQFFTLAGLVGRYIGESFPSDYWNRLQSMYEYIAALCAAGPLPLLGDSDDGYVLDLGGERGDPWPWLTLGGTLFDREDLSRGHKEDLEPTCWILGPDAAGRCCRNVVSEPPPLRSRCFPKSGICLLESGPVDQPRISLTFDCGALGFDALAAHGHADALAVTLRIDGMEFLIDSGTYDYFTFPDWRRHCRSTRAHNTIEIDEVDQSEMLGPFLWGRRAFAKLIKWEHDAGHTLAIAEHDGYSSLADPVGHRRSVSLDHVRQRFDIVDRIIGRKRHLVRQFFHFAPECAVVPEGTHGCRVTRGDITVSLTFDAAVSISVFRGDEDTRLGFISRGYHVREVSTTVVASCKIDGDASLRTILSVHRAARIANMTSAVIEGYNQQFHSQGHQADSFQSM